MKRTLEHDRDLWQRRAHRTVEKWDAARRALQEAKELLKRTIAVLEMGTDADQLHADVTEALPRITKAIGTPKDALHPTADPGCCTGLAPECVAAGKCLHPTANSAPAAATPPAPVGWDSHAFCSAKGMCMANEADPLMMHGELCQDMTAALGKPGRPGAAQRLFPKKPARRGKT